MGIWWEFRVLTPTMVAQVETDAWNAEKLEMGLNRLAADGWEHYDTNGGLMFFKRRREQSPAERYKESWA